MPCNEKVIRMLVSAVIIEHCSL